MKEILTYVLVAFSGLFIMGYSVHMLIGGVVSAETETTIIIAVCLLGLGIIGFMAWDIIKQRTKR